MPTVGDLERLKAIVTQLVPLANARPRTLIKAEDWNLVVGALIETARALLTDDRASLVPPHDHADQVQLSWLDDRLRGLLEKGPLADPASLARLVELDRRIRQGATLLDEVRAVVADIRARVDDVTTKDLARAADVTRVQRTVESLRSSRSDMLALRSSLEALRTDLQRAIEVGRQLEVDGRPLDVAGLLSRVDALETLRDHLTMPNGQPLDATALEVRLTELTNTLVTEEELDEALRTLHPDVSDEVRGQLREEVLGAADERIASVAAGLRTELGASIDHRLSDVDTRVSDALAEGLPGVRDQVLDTARDEIKTAVAKGGVEARAYTDRRVAEDRKQTERTLSERIDAVEVSMATTAEAEAGRQLNARLPQVQAGVDAVGARVDDLGSRAGAAEGALGEHTRVLGTLQSSLTALNKKLDDKVAATLAAANAHAANLVDDAAKKLRAELTTLTGTLVDERVAAAIDGLRGEIREIARDELTAALPEIDARTTRLLGEQLPGRLLDIFRADFGQRGPLYDLITGRRIASEDEAAGREPAAPEPKEHEEAQPTEPKPTKAGPTAPEATQPEPTRPRSAERKRAPRKPATGKRTQKKPPP